MISTIPAAVQALKRHMKALRLGRIERPDDIAFWCLNILATSPTDYSAWATRRAYRAAIRRPREANRNAKGRQALIDFIALTIADLESGYRTIVDVYNLPGVRVLSAESREKMAAAASRQQEERRAEKAKQEAARSARLGANEAA